MLKKSLIAVALLVVLALLASPVVYAQTPVPHGLYEARTLGSGDHPFYVSYHSDGSGTWETCHMAGCFSPADYATIVLECKTVDGDGLQHCIAREWVCNHSAAGGAPALFGANGRCSVRTFLVAQKCDDADCNIVSGAFRLKHVRIAEDTRFPEPTGFEGINSFQFIMRKACFLGESTYPYCDDDPDFTFPSVP